MLGRPALKGRVLKSEQMQQEYTVPALWNVLCCSRSRWSCCISIPRRLYHHCRTSLSSGPCHKCAAGESFVRGEQGEGGQEKGSAAHAQQFCALLFVLKNHTVPVLIYKRIGNLEVTHFHWLSTNSSYERDSKHTVQITLYLNYFRFQSINKSASFDTKSLRLGLFIPTFMLCLLITLKFLGSFT